MSRPVTEPPLADPNTTPELMTPAQREAFARKERARILILNGQMTPDEALTQNLVSAADAEELRVLAGDSLELLHAPLGVIDPPDGPTVPTTRCC